MDNEIKKQIIHGLIDTFINAGNIALDLRDKGLKKIIKEDNTPVTNGDLEVNKIITNKIKEITPKIPIVSEEVSDNKNIENLSTFWLIDPIDWTYDYLNNKEEFTLNAGLIINKRNIPADIIIFATGFDAITGSLLNMDITGANKKKLSSEWHKKPNSYLGLQIPNFPNLFTITGPGSPSVLTNMPRAIEQHVDWITNCISNLIKNKKQKIEASQKSADLWSKKVAEEAKKTMFLKTKNSWYLGTNIKGKPKGFIPYSGGLNKYRIICDEVADNNYEGFLIS